MTGTVLDSAVGKAMRRIAPYLCLMYFISYLDRVNVGFAALTMNHDVGLSATEFGIGASVFFVGFLVIEIPSNLMLARVGARRWIGRIMLSWGIISMAMCLVRGPWSFYVLRLLLGFAEAGFFPGIVVYLAGWFPNAYRGRITGLFMLAIPLSGVIGAPLSSAMLAHADGIAGLHGWQWLFIIEGLPAVIVGLSCFWLLVERPREAAWLTREEQDTLEATLERERKERLRVHDYTLWQGLTNYRVLLLALVLLLIDYGAYAVGFWLPQIFRSLGLTTGQIGFWIGALSVVTAAGMFFWTRHSDSSGERIWHIAGPNCIAAVAFVVVAFTLGLPSVAIVALCIASLGIFMSLPVFWTLPPSFLTGRAAAGGVAVIASLSQFAGLTGPWIIGWSRDATGGFGAAMIGLAATLVLAALITLAFAASVPRASLRKSPA